MNIALTVPLILFLLTPHPKATERAKLPLGLVTPTRPEISKRSRDRVIGSILKNALETYHYKGMKINDNVSKKAFDEYLKKIDYDKQFLLASDVKKLEKYRLMMDDQMISGDHKLLALTMSIFEQRVQEAEKLRIEIFKKPFSFTKDEFVELDGEKRSFPKNKRKWREYWRKLYKYEVLQRYLSLSGAQRDGEDDKKSKKEKKEKKEKKLTDKEMWDKAHQAIEKKYKEAFHRSTRYKHIDYMEKFFNSIANIYDPHTSYLPPKRKKEFDIDISGQLEGIGAVLGEDGPYIKVQRIILGGAAWRQKGLEVDDIILMVGEGDAEPVDLMDMRLDDAVLYIRGKKGTEVRLTVKKVDGTRKVIPIIRDVVRTEAAFAKSSIIWHDDFKTKVGYIFLPKFYRDFDDPSKNCSKDVKEEIERLKKYNIKGIILDLRNNGGGALPDARTISGFFIPSGPIVQTKNYTNKVEVLKDSDGKVFYDGPLIVMTNRFSASASEILAGALQDYKRAIILGGEFTHGKGTVQALIPLNSGVMHQLFGDKMGALKVTVQKFYRVNGVSTQYRGITPDIVIPDPFGYVENREKDLEYGLAWDRIEKKTYKMWNKHKYKIDALKKKSSRRVAKNPRFKKITKSVKYIVKRRNDTNYSLNLKKVMAKKERDKKISKTLKLDDKNEKIMVRHFRDAMEKNKKIAKIDEKRWQEDFVRRKEDWNDRLAKDVGIEEALFVMEDMIKQIKGKGKTANARL